MTEQSQKILSDFQIRKSWGQKRAFRAWLRRELEGAGWTVTEERGRFSGTNVIAGDPEKAEVLFTAHYDTQAVLPFPNFITPRNMGVYLLYQLLIVVVMFFVVAVVSFCSALIGYMAELPTLAAMLPGWLVCAFCIWWVFFGRANRHTANDNTSGVVTLLESALTLPPELRDKACFVFFDNEERGMLGSAAFARKHRRVKAEKLVLNFDCVSDGSSIQFYPTSALKKDETALVRIEGAFLPQSGKTVEVVRGFGFYPSDNATFRRAAGVCALKKGKRLGWYMDRIHTGRDTVFQEENITLLTDGIRRMLAETACPERGGTCHA